MRIDPAIDAMRSDWSRQQRAQAAMAATCDAWRSDAATGQVLAELERYGHGAPLAECPALRALFGDSSSAPRLVAALIRAFAEELSREPFAHPPFRHGYDRGTATLLLARSGRAQLVLHGSEPGLRGFDVVSLSDGERREAVLAGKAEARIVRRRWRSGRFAEQPLMLEPGVRVALDLCTEALQVLAIERRLVAVRLHRFASMPEPTREYRLSDGALLRQSAGHVRASRQEVMLALLGRMRRADAVPVMGAIAREPGDASLRWQALRECLALDTAAGFGALCELACAQRDPLAAPAAALRAQLLEAHPELAGLAIVPCPA